jgi:YebC/PmpR family DNA-binding regulatory protein
MAGHSKWSKVKRFKGALDAKRGQAFSKISREIIIAARSGGDPKLNFRLRQALDSARAQNMPNDTIDRAIKKGTGELEGEAIVEVTYEGFGPGGIAMMVECATDNKNRSNNDVRTIFSKNNGAMGTAGSVSHLFARKGEIRLPLAAGTEDALMETALEAGADDFTTEGDEYVIFTAPDQLFAVVHALKDKSLEVAAAKLVHQAQTITPVADVATATQVIRLYEALDDHDDVQHVYANFDISSEIMEQLSL